MNEEESEAMDELFIGSNVVSFIMGVIVGACVIGIIVYFIVV